VEKYLQALPDDVEERIRDALETAGERPGRELKSLRGRDEYSLRIGGRRAIIDWDAANDELRVLDVDTRDTVYD